MNLRQPERSERGIALVISMLILLVLSLLGLVLMTGASLNRSLAGNDQRMRGSLNVAEAGLGEAEARITKQETLMDPADPDDVCQVFNTVAGSVPVLGADSVALATGQPVGSFLDYTTPGRGPDVLTIAWKKNPAGTAVMRYDGTKNPAIQAASGSPIYTITSTGRVNQARRTVVAEVIQRPYVVQAKGALCADIPIGALGNAVICGYNHSIDTPYDDGNKGRTAVGPPNDPIHCGDNETGANNLPGMWSTSTIDPGGAFQGYGDPAAWQQSQVGFYSGPWDALSMSQADFWGLIGAPVDVGSKSNLNGVFNVDNNTVTQDASASLACHNVDGEGMLYVDGDLHLNSGFHYKGLIYVEGNFDINGQAWVLGGIIVNGSTTITSNGGMTLLYSSDAITQMLTKYGGQFTTLSWREQ